MSQNDDPFQDEGIKKPENDDDIIDLLDSLEEADDEEILELKETVDEMDVPDEDDDVIELSPEAEIVIGEDEDIIELADEANIATDEDEDIIELADEADMAADEDVLELTDEATEPEIADNLTETTDQAAVETDEDKQILELIDDIQSTLDETKEAEIEGIVDDADQISLPDDDGKADELEDSFEKPIILGDEETLETEDLSYSESEFVDHLGLDLTSEFSKELFSEDSEVSAFFVEKLDDAVQRVIHKMLSDKDSPLVQAIREAAKKETG